jgi:subtilisin-like proprotein convertase family protein
MKKRILFIAVLLIAALVFTSALLAEESVNLHLIEGNGAGGDCFATGTGVITPIPDNVPTGACADIILAADAGATVTDITIDLTANHSWIGDLQLWLNSPDGGQLMMLNRPGFPAGTFGDSSDLVDSSPISFFDSATYDAELMGTGTVVCQDDAECDFRPNSDGAAGNTSFADFNGENVNGTWQLCAADNAAGDTGGITLGVLNVTCEATAAPAVVFTKTVGLDSSCATTDSIVIPAGGGGTEVTYCYTMENTGNTTFEFHTVTDSHLGELLGPNFPFVVAPGNGAYFTVTALITQTTVNTAIWDITDGQGNVIVSADDTATVTRGTPTDVSLSSFGQDKAALSPLLLGSLLLVVVGLGFAMRRKLFTS